MVDSAVVDSGPMAAIVASSTSGLMTSEVGASATFPVVLAKAPTGNVVHADTHVSVINLDNAPLYLQPRRRNVGSKRVRQGIKHRHR